MALWTPSNLNATLTCWYLPENATTEDIGLAGGVSVTSITNAVNPLVGQVVQISTGRRPTTDITTLNGHRRLVFDGTNDILSDGDISDLDVGTGDIWMAAVFKSTDDSAAQVVFEKNKDQFSLLITNNGVLQARLGGDSNIPTQSAGNWSRTGFVIVTASRVSSLCKGFVNGAAMTTSNTTNTGSIDNSDVLDLGAAAVGGQALTGEICEILLGGGTITDAELVEVDGYLAAKYALSGNLDSTHKYKSFAPAIGLHGVHNQDLIGELALDVSGPLVSDTLAGAV
jgi:hypothetical protein